MDDLVKGDYVLATKWSDGDPQDPWCVGFYAGYDQERKRHHVVDNEGKTFRLGGFRRAKRISAQRGEWLIKHKSDIEQCSRSLWGWLRHPMKEALNDRRRD